MYLYGTETGMKGGDDPDCRRCFDWSMEQSDMNIHKGIKRLIEIRNRFDCLRKGGFRWIETCEIISFERRYGEERIVVAINNTAERVNLKPEEDTEGYTDLLTGERLGKNVSIPALSSRIMFNNSKEDKFI